MTWDECEILADRFHGAAAMPPKTAADSVAGIVASPTFQEGSRAYVQRMNYLHRKQALSGLGREFDVEVRLGVRAPLLSEAEIDDHTLAGHRRVRDVLLSVCQRLQQWAIARDDRYDMGDHLAVLRLLNFEHDQIDQLEGV